MPMPKPKTWQQSNWMIVICEEMLAWEASQCTEDKYGEVNNVEVSTTREDTSLPAQYE